MVFIGVDEATWQPPPLGKLLGILHRALRFFFFVGWLPFSDSSLLLCFLSIISTSFRLLCLSHGILTHVVLVGKGLGWLCVLLVG